MMHGLCFTAPLHPGASWSQSSLACRKRLRPRACSPRPSPRPCAPPPALLWSMTSTPARTSVVVVGAGPAGYFAAITAARATADAPGCSVTILEATRAVLHKVRISGGGRCNCTNAATADTFALGYPLGRGRREMLSPLARWSAEDTRAWFEAEGVPLKVEPSGKVFPVSDDAESIVAALERAAREAGVIVKTGVRVEQVARGADGGFSVCVKGGRKFKCDAAVIATGSSREGHRWAEQLGHTVVQPVPSLFTFKVKDTRLEGLAGVAVANAQVTLRISKKAVSSVESQTAGPDDTVAKKRRRRKPGKAVSSNVQRGPVLVTHWGLSGPAIIQASSEAARDLRDSSYRAECVIDWIPDVSREEKCDFLMSARARLAPKNICTVCPFRDGSALPLRLWRSLVIHAGCAPQTKWSEMTSSAIRRIVDELHHSSFAVVGKGEFKEEFVTAGGVKADRNLSTKTMESKVCPGLFFAGETVNIDGKTGGYNFRSFFELLRGLDWAVSSTGTVYASACISSLSFRRH